ncbi:hypothetical protein GC197_10355 [bacterium]|nr:hypothetical protein [bacterium]
MDTSILERQSLTPDLPDEPQQETGNDLQPMQLAEEAQNLLGYDGLLEQLARPDRRRKMWQKLKELDVMPFTQESVEAYKEDAVRVPFAIWRWVADRVIRLSLIIGVTGLLGCLAAWVVVIPLASFYSFAAMLGGFAVAIVTSIVRAANTPWRFWLTTDIKYYREPIPEFALHTAVELIKIDPSAKFSVCSLYEEQNSIDPFLVMQIREEDGLHDYYLEVWNEPGFAGQREA